MFFKICFFFIIRYIRGNRNKQTFMEKKYLKITPAGQMAIKKITVSSMEKSVLERIQKEAGFTLPTRAVYEENLDIPTLSSLLQKGWLRETDMGHFVASTPAPPRDQPHSLDTAGDTATPAISPASPTISTGVVLPKVEVSEEDKAKSYENFLKIMANK